MTAASTDQSARTVNGTFTVTGYNTGLSRGGIHLIGGVLQQKRGAVGTFT